MMKQYGVGESWTKQFVISKAENFVGSSYESFKDGEHLAILG